MEDAKIDDSSSHENLHENSFNTKIETLTNENTILKQINSELLTKIDELTTRLHKYTNGQNHKRYYEKNKQKIKESGSLYLQKLKTENPDKIKEYSRAAYARKKEKTMLEELKNSENLVIKRDFIT